MARQRIRRILGIADEPDLPHPEHSRLVAVANQKGGVGKTTTAVNLAGALALLGQRVLLVDMDPQGNASTALDLAHESGTPSVYETLVSGQALATAVRPVAVLPNLFGVPATVDLAGAEIELVSQVAREGRLRRSLRAYLPEHEVQHGSRLDYVIIDCPPSLGLLTLNALVAVDEVLIPLQSEYYALEGLGHLLTTVQLVQEHLNPGLMITGILLTMYDARTKLAPQVADEVRTHFPERLLQTPIPRSVRVSEAPSYGQTVLEYDPASPGARAYLAAAREFAHDPSFVENLVPSAAGEPTGSTPGPDDVPAGLTPGADAPSGSAPGAPAESSPEDTSRIEPTSPVPPASGGRHVKEDGPEAAPGHDVDAEGEPAASPADQPWAEPLPPVAPAASAEPHASAELVETPAVVTPASVHPPPLIESHPSVEPAPLVEPRASAEPVETLAPAPSPTGEGQASGVSDGSGRSGESDEDESANPGRGGDEALSGDLHPEPGGQSEPVVDLRDPSGPGNRDEVGDEGYPQPIHRQ